MFALKQNILYSKRHEIWKLLCCIKEQGQIKPMVVGRKCLGNVV